MATKKQKQELVDMLKFTPVRVQLTLQGYGGESYAGRVDRKIYDYFKANKYDMEEYSGDWDGEWFDRVPEDMQPFSPGNGYDCDNLWHASGAELSNLNSITVTDENGKDIWDYNLGLDELEDAGVTISESGGTELDELEDGTVVYWGGQGEKGCFFDAELILKQPFDPKKLTIYYENCDGWYIITGVEYDGEELDGYGGYSTTGKWSENKWIIVGDEEVYESIPMEEREEGVDYVHFPTDEEINELSDLAEKEALEELKKDYDELMSYDPAEELDKIWEDAKTDWFDSTVKPERKGEYEVELLHPSWPFGDIVRAEWTGRAWKQDSKSVKIKQWRGLKFDPKELSQ